MKSKLEKLIDEIDGFINKNDFFDTNEIILNLRKIYVENPAKTKSQNAKRNALLGAYKKVLKREIVTYIANRCVDHFNIKATSMSFFNNFCEQILGRKVDNRFVIENFANRIKRGKEFIKLEEKRPPSDRIQLKYTYEEMIYLKMYSDKKFDIGRFNFKSLFNAQCNYLDNCFMIVRLENKSTGILLSIEEIEHELLECKARREKKSIMKNLDQKEKTETKKRKRL